MPPTLDLSSAIHLDAPKVVSHELHVSAVITCDCGSPIPFTIPALITPGRDAPRPCPACGQKYAVQSISYQNIGGEISVESNIMKIGAATKARPSVVIRRFPGDS